MDTQVRNHDCTTYQNEEIIDIKKGPWTVEEDVILAEYVAIHGEGRWNTAARCAGDHTSPFLPLSSVHLYLSSNYIYGYLFIFFFRVPESMNLDSYRIETDW